MTELGNVVRLAGFAGRLAGNEDSVDWFLPILQSVAAPDTFYVARSPNWRFPDIDLQIVNSETLTRFGSLLSFSESPQIRNGDVVILLGARYVEAAGSVLTFDPADWLEIEGGHRIQLGPNVSLERFTAITDKPLQDTLWSELRRASDDPEMETLHLDRARRLLRAIGSSTSLPRLDYFAIALAVAEAGSLPGGSKEAAQDRVRQLASLEIPDQISLLDERLIQLRDEHVSHERDTLVRADANTISLEDLAAPAIGQDYPQSLSDFAQTIGELILESSKRHTPLVVDLARVKDGAAPVGYRLDIAKILILNNLLTCTHQRAEFVRFIPPNTPGIASQVSRGGLATLLAQGLPESDPMRQMWTEFWHPANGVQRAIAESGRLFPARRDVTLPIGRNLISLVDPHFRAWNRDFIAEVDTTISRWLFGRMMALSGRPERRTIEAIVRPSTNIVLQLMANVRRHAQLSRSPFYLSGSGSNSLVQLFTTRGGGGRSSNRLYIAVSDTGIGIPASLRQNRPALANVASSELFEGALEGRYRSDSGDSGFGISDIYRLLTDLDSRDPHPSVNSRLLMLSSDESDTQQVFVRIVSSSGGSDVTSELAWKSPMRGTIALVSVPLNAVTTADSSQALMDDQLEFDLGLV